MYPGFPSFPLSSRTIISKFLFNQVSGGQSGCAISKPLLLIYIFYLFTSLPLVLFPTSFLFTEALLGQNSDERHGLKTVT